MEVGCLRFPGASTIGRQPLDWNNAPMTGTTAQPSHEPPRQRKGTGTRQTDKASVEKKKINRPRGRVGREENGRQNPARRKNTKRAKESHDQSSQPPGMRVLKTADLCTLALLVVNSFKLHLTAFIMLTSFQSQSAQGQPKPFFLTEARLHFPELENGLFVNLCLLIYLRKCLTKQERNSVVSNLKWTEGARNTYILLFLGSRECSSNRCIFQWIPNLHPIPHPPLTQKSSVPQWRTTPSPCEPMCFLLSVVQYPGLSSVEAGYCGL